VVVAQVAFAQPYLQQAVVELLNHNFFFQHHLL
jgi:hypothetical protein